MKKLFICIPLIILFIICVEFKHQYDWWMFAAYLSGVLSVEIRNITED